VIGTLSLVIIMFTFHLIHHSLLVHS
jgi:hypothetical protein